MIRFLSFLSLSITFLMSASHVSHSDAVSKRIQKKVQKEIKSVFKVETFNLEENSFKIPANNFLQASTFQEIHAQNVLQGYAFIGTAPSKTDSFEYLVLLDKDLVIVKAKVLVYREDYGGEIGSKRWLSQFISKNRDSILGYGEEITAISGATISVKSMTASINHFLYSLKEFLWQLTLQSEDLKRQRMIIILNIGI